MKVICGVDTSCYTTSVALLGEDGRLLADSRRGLQVKSGGRGLAQSEMLYQHTRNMPLVFKEAKELIGASFDLVAVGASVCPRPQADSYMPAFLVGEGYAKYWLSHMAADFVRSVIRKIIFWQVFGRRAVPGDGRFLAVHVSGGTTEITHILKNDQRLEICLLGGSLDIAAGQLIDRIGVALGLPFPAGPSLEMLAEQAKNSPAQIPVAVDGTKVSFSGPESHALRLLNKGCDFASIAAGVQRCVAESVARLILAAVKATGTTEVLLVGGVVSNYFIRSYVKDRVCGQTLRLYYPDRQFSGDNAIGAAYYALGCLHN